MSDAVLIKDNFISRIEDFKENNEFWIALGKISEWDDEDNPPEPTGEETSVEEVFVYMKSEVTLDVKEQTTDNVAFVVRDEEDGWIRYRDRTYRAVPQSDIYEEEASNLLVEITLDIDDMTDIDTYRQAGIFLNLQPVSEYEDETILEPDQVDDEGDFYAISNFRRITRVEDRLDATRMIIHFNEGTY